MAVQKNKKEKTPLIPVDFLTVGVSQTKDRGVRSDSFAL